MSVPPILLALGIAFAGAAVADDATADLVDSVRAFARSQSYEVGVRVTIGTERSSAFRQEIRGRVHRRILEIDARPENCYMSPSGKGAAIDPRGRWAHLDANEGMGRTIARLVAHPETHLAAVGRGSRRARETGPRTYRVPVSLDRSRSALTDIQNSQVVRGYWGHSVSIMNRIDPRTQRGHYEVGLDEAGRLRTIRFVVTAEMRDSDETFRFEVAYTISGYDSVEDMRIPREAARFLR